MKKLNNVDFIGKIIDLHKKGVINKEQIDEFHQKLVEATRDAVPNQSDTHEIVVSVSSDGNIVLFLFLSEMKKFYGSGCEIFYCHDEPGKILACLEHMVYGVSFEDMLNLDLNTEEKIWNFIQKYQFLTEKNLREAMKECGVKPKEDWTIPCPKGAEERTPEGYVINRTRELDVVYGYRKVQTECFGTSDGDVICNIHIPADKHMEEDDDVYLLADSQLRTIDVFDSVESLMYEYSLNNWYFSVMFGSYLVGGVCKWSEISKSK